MAYLNNKLGFFVYRYHVFLVFTFHVVCTSIINSMITDKPFKYLGLYIGHKKTNCDTINWNEKLLKAKIIK